MADLPGSVHPQAHYHPRYDLHPMVSKKLRTLTENDKQRQMAELLAQLGDEVHLLTSLLEGGHLEPEEAYYKVKELWQKAKHTKRELFPELTRDSIDN